MGQASPTALLALLVVTLAHALSSYHTKRLGNAEPSEPPETALAKVLDKLQKTALKPVVQPAPAPAPPPRPVVWDQRKASGTYKVVRENTGSHRTDREPTGQTPKKT